MERLDLTRQGLTNANLSCLGALLARNRHLLWLGLGSNHFSLGGFESFLAQVLAHNRTLLTLQIDHNDNHDDDVVGGAQQERPRRQWHRERRERWRRERV